MSRPTPRLPGSRSLATIVVGALLLAGCAGGRSSGPPVPKPVPPPAAEHRSEFETSLDQARTALARGDLPAVSQALDVADALSPDQPSTLYLRAEFAAAEGDSDAALDYYRRAWSGDPSGEHRDALTRALLDRAQAKFRAQDLDGAEKLVEEAGGVDPAADLDRLRGLIAYARAERTQGDESTAYLGEAETSFRRSLERTPGDPETSLDLAGVLLALGRYPEAADLYRGLLARNPEDGGLYLALSRAEGMAGNTGLGEALEAAGRALRAGDPVADPAGWAQSGARRYPDSELATTVQDLGPPDAIRTYGVPGGGLVEVWFYRNRGVVDVFRDGTRVGTRILIGS
jgi:tetratricopeptide (TPR) repeat protein